MSETKKLQLVVVSQNQQLLDQAVDSITVPALEGEMTILPHHIPLFTPLTAGEVVYRTGPQTASLVVSKGFLDIGPEGSVTIMVDAAVHDRDISMQKAEEAVRNAQQTLIQSKDAAELLRAEAELRRALLEIKVAQKTKRTTL
jgi:F-type H+-transporting ATPase subunit epsilon